MDTPLLSSSSGGDEGSSVQEAIGRVQRVLLKSIATRSGLTDCVVVSNQRDSSWRRSRRLIPQERGSTSIVGLSLSPGDEVDAEGEFLNACRLILCLAWLNGLGDLYLLLIPVWRVCCQVLMVTGT